jgi:hypothetical protein
MHFARACEVKVGDIIAIKEDCDDSLTAIIYLEIKDITNLPSSYIKFGGILHIENYLEQEDYYVKCYQYDQVLVLNS